MHSEKLRVILLLGAVLATAPACMGARLLADWSAVEQTEPGRRVRVFLYEDRAPSATLRFDGALASATSDGVTLVLKDGSTQTFANRTVRRVSRRRPFFKRTRAWVITGASLVVVGFFAELYRDSRPDPTYVPRGIAMGFMPIFALASVTSSHVIVYNVPEKHRSP